MEKDNFSTKDEKKQLLFLHGYLCSGEIFNNQVKYFSKYFRCYSPDLTGFGKNSEMPYPFNLDDYIFSVKEYMRQNKIVNPLVIAHSFGGRIAIKMSALEPNIFDKIVLTGAAGIKPKRTLKYRLKKIQFDILKHFIKKEKLGKYYSKDYNALNAVMKESFKKIISENLEEYLPKIEQPTLIINGELDAETPLYTAKKLNKEIKGSEKYIMKKVGHFCFLEKPNEFNIITREFLI